MTKVLRSSHAEDMGTGRAIEPGQQIPEDADPQVVARLHARGLIEESAPKAKPKPKAKAKAKTPTEEE